ncbi:NAD-dependent epimerase/dehydratase family protein [Nocardia harenae]|uniref:NAD-dependent epimerase/dehydratase family protein n=1 Tax=Nocardia harenae TaxID=358707 RepID=UPI00083574CB|nr:NAD-dependent epimerase/dehydratase family protein [Nocardia harenae]
MKVVITGVSGDFGTSVLPAVLRRGHDVVGISRGSFSHPSRRYRHAAADIRDVDALTEAMDGADVVIHLAWTTHPSHDTVGTRAVDIGGTEAVLEAMRRAGCPRLVFSSSVTVYGYRPLPGDALYSEDDKPDPSPRHRYAIHKVEAENLIDAAGLNALHIRGSNIMGRNATGVTREGFALPALVGVRGGGNRFQFVHDEDVARFFAEAVEHPEWTGPVNLATTDTTTMPEIAELLGKPYITVPRSALRRTAGMLWRAHASSLDPGAIEAFTDFPCVRTERLRDEFGFQCAWTSRDAVLDFRRANRAHIYLGSRRVRLPWRWGRGVTPQLSPETLSRPRAAGAAGVVPGEFDTLIDPRYSVFTCANTSEAFPGPMTPASVESGIDALRAAGAQCAEVLRIRGELARILTDEQVGVFGHGVYANLSVVYAMARSLPGGDLETWEDKLFGNVPETVDIEPISTLSMLSRLPWILAQALSFNRATLERDAAARTAQLSAPHLPDLPDRQLDSRLTLMKDEVSDSWSLATQGVIFVTTVLGIIEKRVGKAFATTIRGGTEQLASAGPARGAHRLAEAARADSELAAVLRGHPAPAALAKVRASHPRFAADLQQVLDEYGHRGPRETELINRVFADAPEMLLDVVTKLLDSPARPSVPVPNLNPATALLARTAVYYQQARERARDAAIRNTHLYRQAIREKGRRLREAGLLDEADDVFFLILDEMLCPPADISEIVARRRSDRDRLAALRMPATFTAKWEPVRSDQDALTPGERLQGTGVSQGTVTGTVRVLTVDTMDDLNPGEILVAAFTDTGWTPFFAFAAAVVVDTGGEMSHAAVVAREFGVPCVVNTGDASRRLRDGQTVQVDGAKGTVTVLS